METKGFAISTWHDTKDIYNKLDQLMQQPMRPIKRNAMQQYLDYFDNKCRKSKEMITEAKQYIPGGVQHNLAFNYPYPLVMNKAEGAYLWDIDGNKYIDFLQSGGPIILGNNYEPVREKVIDLLNDCGPVTGLFHEYEYKIAKLINKHMPAVEMFRMLGSGTEAVMAAIRIARLATGKKKVIKIGGAYHGWSDQMVYGLKIPGTGRFEAHGIPRASTRHTQEVKPNNLGALRRQLQRNKLMGGTASVIVEPVGPESGTRPIYKDYNREVRKLCDEFDTLLIFDEVVTGFRMGLGGAQGYFDVKPDLTVFGKVIAGGYPAAGGIGGRRELIERLAAGLESGKKRAYVGGTLAANPLSALAGYYTILEIEKTNACKIAGKAGDRLTNGLNELIAKYKLPFVAYNQGSICHLETAAAMFVKLGLNIFSALDEIKKRKHMMEEMGAAYMAEGIVSLAGSRLYTSLADTDDVIDDALERFERVFQNIEGVGV
ncbi:aspartate aminotransferase family protein [Bacillus solimangrovi]|uniref:Glutamate-1-semialdehyde aminotransferase n=1 Tax=Bacillus solimangrovi TaxID=1305675 RepID=A0A1E5LJM7_9BACI|nr:aminotransferase class III-fold pyridoxal phosphate-dependent enzyme [Bacillus solimangrovi]OEH94271.1 glutamate-1-semialdehyde aminotransferase [Bacillus solimangrovi]